MLTYKLSKSTGNGHIYFLQYENGWVRSKIDLSLLFGKDEAEGLFQSFNAVRHGHWEEYLAEGLRWKCSECGSRFETPYHYCPNCGAKMDEEEK